MDIFLIRIFMIAFSSSSVRAEMILHLLVAVTEICSALVSHAAAVDIEQKTDSWPGRPPWTPEASKY